MSSYFPAQIEQLKRRAKLLARSSSCTHGELLDRVAREEGFDNWSLLMRDCNRAAPYHFVRTLEEWREALRPSKDCNALSPQDFAPRLIELVGRFISPYNASLFALEYMQSLLSLPRYRIWAGSLVLAEMRWWLPYSVHDVVDDASVRLLLNRHYKPVGSISREHVDYARFERLHARLSFDQLRTFSKRNGASGYLFDDGTAPWISRSDAVAYAEKLEQLCAVLKGNSSETFQSSWTRTQDFVYEYLAPWASVPTWYTSHPSDERRMLAALEELQRVSDRFDEKDLRAALSAHRKQTPDLLGGGCSDARFDVLIKRCIAFSGSQPQR